MIDGGFNAGLVAALTAISLVACAGAAIFLWAHARLRQRHRQLRRLARRRAERLGEALRLFRMAERIADLGIWQYFPDDDRQDWSDGMKRLFGVDPLEPLVEGDVETLLAANEVDLVEIVMDDPDAREPVELDFSILRLDGEQRELTLNACRMRDRNGQNRRVMAVVMDVTEQRRRERRLKKSRAIALREVRRAKELAETDALTGLANRRRAMVQIDRLTLQARKLAEPLSLIAFDVDHFKRVNDAYGHPAGDAVLRRIAEIAQEQARDGDIVGRIGGEEFVWVLPGADLDTAGIVADRLRLAIEAGSAAGKVPPVTVSVGLASVLKGDTGLSLFARADAALYDAKHAGRNTVRMAA